MAYYNREGKILVARKMKYLRSGICGAVHHNREIIFKKYFSNTSTDLRLTAELFDILKDIDNEHLMKLIDIYSEMNLLELIRYKNNARRFTVDAYTAKYYCDDSVNVLYESIDYLLDNFSELEKLFAIFTDNSIVTKDVKRGNSILSPSGIIIIDPDIFYKETLPKQDIAIANKNNLLSLFASICIDCLGKTENIEEIQIEIENASKIKRRIIDSSSFDVDDKTNITYEISKRLKRVKRPIDYLIK